MSWEEVKAMLAQARTPEEKKAAAEALGQHIPQELKDKQLVTMQKGGVHTVRLGDLHQAMQEPTVYDRVKKIMNGR